MSKSKEHQTRRFSRACRTLPPKSDQDSRPVACLALQRATAKLGAGETVDGRTPRKLGAARPVLQVFQGPKGVVTERFPTTVVSVLGPEPYSPGQVLKALRAGRSVRDVDKALAVLMPRRRARILIQAAKAILQRQGTWPTTRETDK